MGFLSRRLFLVIFIVIGTITANAQVSPGIANKGKMYVLWGWNWGFYSKSNIRFTGADYDFELADVKAVDNPTKFSWDDYFNPAKITIPQTNFRIGYYLKDNWNISIGVDHMKYVMLNDQTVKISGVINSGTAFDGTYNNEDIVLTNEFLQFEHTDGLNYINVEMSYVKDVFSWLGNPKENLQVYLTGGAGVGMLFPKTNTALLGKPRHDDFNVAGYGMALKGGINITFFKYFFIQSEIKGGFINMNNIRTTPDKVDKASQNFFYAQPDILFGAIFRISNK